MSNGCESSTTESPERGLLDTLGTLRLRCGYIINGYSDAVLEAQEMRRLIDTLLASEGQNNAAGQENKAGAASSGAVFQIIHDGAELHAPSLPSGSLPNNPVPAAPSEKWTLGSALQERHKEKPQPSATSRTDALTGTFYLRCDDCPQPEKCERMKSIHPDDYRQLERELAQVKRAHGDALKEWAYAEGLLRELRSAIGRWREVSEVLERQVAWIDRDARHVAVVVKGREFILTLPILSADKNSAADDEAERAREECIGRNLPANWKP